MYNSMYQEKHQKTQNLGRFLDASHDAAMCIPFPTGPIHYFYHVDRQQTRDGTNFSLERLRREEDEWGNVSVNAVRFSFAREPLAPATPRAPR